MWNQFQVSGFGGLGAWQPTYTDRVEILEEGTSSWWFYLNFSTKTQVLLKAALPPIDPMQVEGLAWKIAWSFAKSTPSRSPLPSRAFLSQTFPKEVFFLKKGEGGISPFTNPLYFAVVLTITIRDRLKKGEGSISPFTNALYFAVVLAIVRDTEVPPAKVRKDCIFHRHHGRKWATFEDNVSMTLKLCFLKNI